ncbi:MAG: outer membrane protein assembly factor BamA [Verrucomicrobia bacterium]|nr:outer membrane protein assembly factor BamA [Verrucomicrobiota bacterium]MBS0636805.1 outer membrane protein assembly factor BamA [Verrucomicrobiota bacterium]
MRTLLILLVLTLQLAANEVTPQYEHSRVQKIDVIIEQDSSQADSDKLLGRLKTKEGALFSQEEFDEDLKSLAKEFDKIDPQITVQPNGSLDITLHIWVKPTIKTIVWQGNKEFTSDKLTKELGIRPGQVFDRQNFNKAFHKIKTFYLKKGFFEAELDYTVHPVKPTNDVDVHITIKEGRSGQIDKIAFHGITKKEKNELLELIFTKTYNFFTSWLTDEGTHNPEVLRHDELTILSYLQNEGYADAKVDIKILESKTKKDRIIVDVNVDKGALYHVSQISMSGNTVLATDHLLDKIALKTGGVYSPEKLRQSVSTIKDLYGMRGYIDAQIIPDSKIVEGKKEYSVNFQVIEGSRFRVGLIKVFGNQRTDASVILHEIVLTPGEIFDSTLLSKSEERLRNIGYFKNVNIYAVKTSRGDHFRDVYVEVEENPNTASLNFFLTFNSTEKLSGGVSANETNFNSKGLLTLFSKGPKGLRGGGEYVSANVTVGQKQLVYSASWTKPNFMDTPWIIGLQASKMRNSYASDDYSIKAYSAQAYADYPINAFVKAGVTYRITHSHIHLKHMSHDHNKRELERESKNGGLISAIGPHISYDSTDHPHQPKRGIRSSFGIEYAGLGGDHTFIKTSYLNSIYWSPYQYGVVRLRGNLQFIQTLGHTHPKDLPLDERFYMGGEQSIRGYLFNSVGPKFHDSFHTSRGGMSSVLLSAEYDQYIFKRMDGFVFLDAGNVYFKQFYLGTLRASAGYGIKLKVFGNAPLVLGIGYPLNPAHKRDVKKFFFSIGTSF